MAEHSKIFRWTDQDEEFFGLFIRANDVIAEDDILIRVFEEFFLNFYPEQSLIIWLEFFKIIVLLHMSIIAIQISLTPEDVHLAFNIEFSLVFRTNIRTWP